MKSKLRSCLALTTAVSLASCSYMTTRGPADPTGATEPTCNKDADAPWLDAVAAGSFVLPGLIAAAGASGECNEFDQEFCEGSRIGVAGLGIGFLVLALSASNGYSKLRRCRKAHERWQSRSYQAPTYNPPSMTPPGMRAPGTRAPARRPRTVPPAPAPAAQPAPAPAPAAQPAPAPPPAAPPTPAPPPPAQTAPPAPAGQPDFWEKKDS